MCLVVLRWDPQGPLPLVVAANRDELHQRPTAPAEFWGDAPGVLAGRDLLAGGTWLGVSSSGRFAALTNYREGLGAARGEASRGELVAGFLRGDAAAEVFAAGLGGLERYGGFSLLLCDGRRLVAVSNRGRPGVSALGPGTYGLSNHLLETPWPKVERTKARLAALLERADAPDPDALLELLADRTGAPDPALPDTGVGLALERALAPVFLAGPVYGTRCSTAVVARRGGGLTFVERRFDATGLPSGETRQELVVPSR